MNFFCFLFKLIDCSFYRYFSHAYWITWVLLLFSAFLSCCWWYFSFMNIWLGMFNTKFITACSSQTSIKGAYFISCFNCWKSLLKPSLPGTQSKDSRVSHVSIMSIILESEIVVPLLTYLRSSVSMYTPINFRSSFFSFFRPFSSFNGNYNVDKPFSISVSNLESQINFLLC